MAMVECAVSLRGAVVAVTVRRILTFKIVNVAVCVADIPFASASELLRIWRSRVVHVVFT